jgi:[ribosomal protein S5]-alanine N-acetyltransferase
MIFTTDHENERLRLKALDPGFAPQVLRYYETNADFRAAWSPVPPADFFTLRCQTEMLEEEVRAREAGTHLKAWLFLREDTELETVIGFASLSNIIRGPFLSCHLGYEMHGDHLNRGYITEALRAMVFEAAFGALGLHRVEANVMPRNVRSIRVLEKLGFREEGLARKYLRINGVWEDHLHYVVLNDALP